MRLLVTGASGQLASALRERGGGGADTEIICVDRAQLDLTRPESIWGVVRAVRPDVIVGAAAYTAVDMAEDEPALAQTINAVAPGLLAAAAKDAGARLIHLSTDYVYDGRKAGPYFESDQTGPLSVYGRTKLEGEAAVRDQSHAYIILRTAWIYGPFGRNFVKTILQLAATRETLTVVDDQHGCPTSATDLAHAVLTIADRWQSDPGVGLGQIYHCAGSGSTTWCQLARHALQASRETGGPFAEVYPITTREWPTKALRPANTALDCSKLMRDFRWCAPEWRDSVDVVVRRLTQESYSAVT
jgi:dTDP-4-dehydrorhamnose reductase